MIKFICVFFDSCRDGFICPAWVVNGKVHARLLFPFTAACFYDMKIVKFTDDFTGNYDIQGNLQRKDEVRRMKDEL
jgi:hypothetical protein